MQVRISAFPDRDTALSSWWESPLGRALLAAESELLSEALEDVFGWDLLQVGAWGDARELLAGSRTRRKSVIAAVAEPVRADIIGRPSLLPVISDCVDAALLPHTLEFAADPYAVLREVDRVLAGEGQLLVLGFRPWSLWGMRARWSRSGFPPGMRRLMSERLLREWLVLLGYEVVAARRYLYFSPWSRGLARGAGCAADAARRTATRCPPGLTCSRRASASTP